MSLFLPPLVVSSFQAFLSELLDASGPITFFLLTSPSVLDESIQLLDLLVAEGSQEVEKNFVLDPALP